MGISNGRIIMINGVVIGEGGVLLTTKKGVGKARERNVSYKIIDLNKSKLYKLK